MGIKVKDFLTTLGVLHDTSSNGEETQRFVWPKHTMREIRDYSEMVYQYPNNESNWSVRFKALGCYKISPFESNPSSESSISKRSSSIPNATLLSRDEASLLTNRPKVKKKPDGKSHDENSKTSPCKKASINSNSEKQQNAVKRNLTSNGTSKREEKNTFMALMEDLQLSDSDDPDKNSLSHDDEHKKENLPKISSNNKLKKENSTSKKKIDSNRKSKKVEALSQLDDERTPEEISRVNGILHKAAALLSKNNELKERLLISPLGDRFQISDEDDVQTPQQSIDSCYSHSDQDGSNQSSLLNNKNGKKGKKISSPRKSLETKESFILPSKMKMENLNDTFYQDLTKKSSIRDCLKEPFVDERSKSTQGIVILPHDIELPEELLKINMAPIPCKEEDDHVNEKTLPLVEEVRQLSDGEVEEDDEEVEEEYPSKTGINEVDDDDDEMDVVNPDNDSFYAPTYQDHQAVPLPPSPPPPSSLPPSTTTSIIPNHLINDQPSSANFEESAPLKPTSSFAAPVITTYSIGINTSPQINPEESNRPDKDIGIQFSNIEVKDECKKEVHPMTSSLDHFYSVLCDIDKKAEDYEQNLLKNSSIEHEQNQFEKCKSEASVLWSNLGAYISATSSDYGSPLQNVLTMHTGHPSCEPNYTTYPIVMLSAARHLLQSAYLYECVKEDHSGALETYSRLNDLIDSIDKRISKAEVKINKRVKRFHNLLNKNGTDIGDKKIFGLNWPSMWTYLLARIKSMILFREYNLRQKNLADFVSLNELDSCLRQDNTSSTNGTKPDEASANNSSFLTFLSEPIDNNSMQDRSDQQSIIGRNLFRDEKCMKNCFNLLKLYNILHRAFTKWKEAEALSTSCLSSFNMDHLTDSSNQCAHLNLTPQSLDYKISKLTNHLSMPLANNLRIGQIFLYFDNIQRFHELIIDALKQSLITLNLFSIPKILLEKNTSLPNNNNNYYNNININSNSNSNNSYSANINNKSNNINSSQKSSSTIKLTFNTNQSTTIPLSCNNNAFSTENTDDDSISNPHCTPTKVKKKEKSLKRPCDRTDSAYPNPAKVNGHSTAPSYDYQPTFQPQPSHASNRTEKSKSCKRSKSDVSSLCNSNAIGANSSTSSSQKPLAGRKSLGTSASSNGLSSDFHVKDRPSKSSLLSSTTTAITNNSTSNSHSVSKDTKSKPSKSSFSKTPNIQPYENNYCSANVKGQFSSSNSLKASSSKQNRVRQALNDSDTETNSPAAGSLTYTPTPLSDLKSTANSSSNPGRSNSKTMPSSVPTVPSNTSYNNGYSSKTGSKTPSYKLPYLESSSSGLYSPHNLNEPIVGSSSIPKRKRNNESYEPCPVVSTKTMSTYNPTSSVYLSKSHTQPSAHNSNVTSNSNSNSNSKHSSSIKHVYNPTPQSGNASSGKYNNNNLSNQTNNGKVPQFFNNWLNTSVNNRR